MLTATKEFACGHFLGTKACIGNSQVDIITNGEEENSQHGCKQYLESRLIALYHTYTFILWCKYDICKRCQTQFIIAPCISIILLKVTFYLLFLSLKVRTRFLHKKGLDGTCGCESKHIIFKSIASHLRITLYARNHLRFIRQDSMVEILGYSADGIHQSTVVRICIVDIHMAIAHNL